MGNSDFTNRRGILSFVREHRLTRPEVAATLEAIIGQRDHVRVALIGQVDDQRMDSAMELAAGLMHAYPPRQQAILRETVEGLLAHVDIGGEVTPLALSNLQKIITPIDFAAFISAHGSMNFQPGIDGTPHDESVYEFIMQRFQAEHGNQGVMAVYILLIRERTNLGTEIMEIFGERYPDLALRFRRSLASISPAAIEDVRATAQGIADRVRARANEDDADFSNGPLSVGTDSASDAAIAQARALLDEDYETSVDEGRMKYGMAVPLILFYPKGKRLREMINHHATSIVAEILRLQSRVASSATSTGFPSFRKHPELRDLVAARVAELLAPYGYECELEAYDDTPRGHDDTVFSYRIRYWKPADRAATERSARPQSALTPRQRAIVEAITTLSAENLGSLRIAMKEGNYFELMYTLFTIGRMERALELMEMVEDNIDLFRADLSLNRPYFRYNEILKHNMGQVTGDIRNDLHRNLPDLRGCDV